MTYLSDLRHIKVDPNAQISETEKRVLVERAFQAGERFIEIRETQSSDEVNPDMTSRTHLVRRLSCIKEDGSNIVLFQKNFLGNKEGLLNELNTNKQLKRMGLQDNTWTIISKREDPYLITKHVEGLIAIETLLFADSFDDFLLKKLFNLIALIHVRCGIIHGDLQPKNMGVVLSEVLSDSHSTDSLKGVYIIDFEYARLNQGAEFENGVYRDLETFLVYFLGSNTMQDPSILADLIIDSYKSLNFKIDKETLLNIILRVTS